MKASKNIKDSKITTGTGIAMIILLVAKKLGLDLGEALDIPITDLALYAGGLFSSVLLWFAKDHNK